MNEERRHAARPNAERRDVRSQLVAGMVDDSAFISNVSDEVFATTVSKARVCLERNKGLLNAGPGRLSAPFGIGLSCLIALVTATFHDFILSAGNWKFTFQLFLLISAVWLLYELGRLICRRVKMGRQNAVDFLIMKLVEENKLLRPNEPTNGPEQDADMRPTSTSATL